MMKKLLSILFFAPFMLTSCKTVDADDSAVYALGRSCTNKYISEALDTISTEEGNAVLDLLTTVCQHTDKTDKLFADNYGWEGNSNNFSSYLYRYSESVQGVVLHTKTGITMQFPKKEEQVSYAYLLYKAYTDEAFRKQHYKLPNGITITNVQDLTGFSEDGFSIKYRSTVKPMTTPQMKRVQAAFVSKFAPSTVYDTTLTFTKINDNLFTFTERSYENGKLTRKAISFLVKEYLDQDKLIQLEDREVNFKMSQALSTAKAIANTTDKALAAALYQAINSFK